jgi:hypothetical protein
VNGHIYGVDRNNVDYLREKSIINDNRVTLITNVEAYNNNTVLNHLKNLKFDIIIDDGSHVLNDMIKVIEYYLPLVKDTGMLIIEDIPSDIKDFELSKWINALTEATPEKYKKCIKVIDLTHIKGRGDDVLFIIDLSKQ